MIMEQPYPIELLNKGDTILLLLEEYDSVRTISMAAASNVDSLPRTLLGRSKGRWEGDALVVTTTRIDWPYFDPSGHSAGRLLEHRGTVHHDDRRHTFELHDDRHRSVDIYAASRTKAVVGVAAY